ncbi:hypothetical protein K438DRAFT_1766182 [Mycena galopus ATCC 62051]|nr:hypothetical protein K438DRAFT_1766182 [Mycena galopus ATCC 62051]
MPKAGRCPVIRKLCGGSWMYESGHPGKVFDKSGRRTEDGSQVRQPEYSDVGGSVKTTENDGKPNNVNNQSKTFYSNSGDRNVKPEEDGDEQMITGSHPVVVRMSSGDEPEVNRRRPGVDWEMTGRWPEVIGITRMIGNSDGVEEERQRKLIKAEVELPHRRREFEPEDKRHPESRGLSRKRLTYAGVRVGDPANTEGMNEGGREPGVQRKSRKKAKTSPIARPEVVSEIVAELFRSRNLLHVCSTIEPERTEVTERRFGGSNFPCRNLAQAEPIADGCKPEVLRMIHISEPEDQGKKVGKRTEDGDQSNIVQCQSWMVIFLSSNVGAGKPGSSSGNGNGRKGEGKPDGMPEQLPEEGMERTEDAGKDVRSEDENPGIPDSPRRVREGEDKESGGKDSGSGGRCFTVQSNSWNTGTETVMEIVTDIMRAPETSGNGRGPRLCRKCEVREGYAGWRERSRFHLSEVRRNYVRYRPSCPARETGAGTNRRIRPEGPFVPEVASASPLEESRGGSELVKGPEEDELAE